MVAIHFGPETMARTYSEEAPVRIRSQLPCFLQEFLPGWIHCRLPEKSEQIPVFSGLVRLRILLEIGLPCDPEKESQTQLPHRISAARPDKLAVSGGLRGLGNTVQDDRWMQWILVLRVAGEHPSTSVGNWSAGELWKPGWK